MVATEKRIHMRFDKVFAVVVSSELYGECAGVARNLSAGGMMVEMIDPLPLGSVVTVQFHMPDCTGCIRARAEVKHHYCFNFNHADQAASTRGIGLRFVEFIEDSGDRFQHSFTRDRVLH